MLGPAGVTRVVRALPYSSHAQYRQTGTTPAACVSQGQGPRLPAPSARDGRSPGPRDGTPLILPVQQTVDGQG